jgi:adenosylmethionine-8-amino-7-oxononanoate aminotransferase
MHETSATTVDLRQLTKHVMVDFNQMKTFSSAPLIMVDGDGIVLTDDQGRRYIDGLSGVFAVSLGHGNEEIIDAIAAQHRRVAFSSPIMTTTDRALELAAALIRVTGGRYDVVKQLNSGSEATEAALKMARQYHRQSGSPERYKTISFYRSYHGATMGALTSTGWPQLRTPYEPFLSGGIHAHPPIPGSCRACAGICTLGCLDQMRDVVEQEGARTVSAIIVEPVMLTAGVQPLSADYLRRLRSLCDETGVLLIFDEIVTGFGRLGSWFAAEQADVWPDILCVGKGLSSGYAPLSAVLLTEKIARAFWGEGSAGVQYQAGHTFAGNPVSAACGLAVIRYIEEHRVLDNVLARGAELESRLGEIVDRYPICAAVRGRGLLYCVDFVDPATGAPLDPAEPVGTAVQQAARKRGLLIRASIHNATLAPPLILTAAEVTEIADIFEESVAEVSARVATGEGVKLDVAFGL